MSIKEGTVAMGGLGGDNLGSGNANNNPILVARVYYILLNEDLSKQKEMNVNPGSIGAIQCRIVSNNFVDENEPLLVAQPLDPFIKRFPVQNELVSITAVQTSKSVDGKDNSYVTYYYKDIIGVWDSTEHNAVPDNTFFNRSNKNAPDTKSYGTSQIGISKFSNAPESKNVTGKNFKETGKIRKLKHLPGDFIMEGRFGNSIRIGNSNKSFKDSPWNGDDSNPVLIFRNGQHASNNDPWLPIYEDINLDGSIAAMFSGQTIQFVPACDNFATYNQTEVTKIGSVVAIKNDDIGNLFNSTFSDTGSAAFRINATGSAGSGSAQPENELDSIPDNEDDFQYNKEFEDEVPLRNGTILSPYFGNVFSTKYSSGESSLSKQINLKSAPSVTNNDISLVESYSGKIDSDIPGLTKGGRALLDLIALTEGTMGRGNFNGYDYIVGGKLIPGYDSVSSSPPHPNVKVPIARINNFSTAAGRYQFLYSINWYADGILKYGLTGMSKYNQNYLAWKTITVKRNISAVDIDRMATNFNEFKLIIGGRSDTDGVDGLSPEYASLPDSYRGSNGFYGQAGRYSFESLFQIYQQILTHY